jgi:hypothetical protein
VVGLAHLECRVRELGIVAIAIGAASCVRTAPTPQFSYWISSDASQYSPAARFHVVSMTDGSRLRVIIDSGMVTVPGAFTAQSPPLMNKLYLTAYLATTNIAPMGRATSDSIQYADRRGWRALAASDSLLLIDQLRYGEQRPIGDVQLTLSAVSAAEGPRWLVFRISGNAVDLRIPYDERGALRVGPPGTRIRVYACSDRDLRGQVDTTRSNALRRAYGLLC